MQALAVPVPVVPERAPASALVLVLEDHRALDLAALLVPAAQRPPAKRRARSALLPAEAVADVRSIRRPKKVR